MTWRNLDVPVRQVVGGNVGLILCLALYLVWWCVTFKPGASGTPFGTVCIIVGALAGILGLVFVLMGLSGIPAVGNAIPNWWFVVGGLIAYVVLMFSTYLLLHRPVTTELFLIVGFAVLELYAINVLRSAGCFSMTLSVVLVVVLAIVVIGSLVGYMLYYQLGGMAGYIDGMVPLAVSAAYLVVFDCAVLLAR